jgi:hypothetical protein
LTAYYLHQYRIDIDFPGFSLGTRPIRPPSGMLAALFVLARPPDDELLGRIQLRFLG